MMIQIRRPIFCFDWQAQCQRRFPRFTKDSISTEKWMGKLGIDYAGTEDLLVYATYSNALNLVDLMVPFEHHVTAQTLQRGRVTALEIGIKVCWMKLDANELPRSGMTGEDKQEQDLAVAFVGNIGGLNPMCQSRALTVLSWICSGSAGGV